LLIDKKCCLWTNTQPYGIFFLVENWEGLMEAIRKDLLDACRGLAAYGLGTGIGGQVSIRVPGEDLMISHAFDKSFEEMHDDDIFAVDFDGKPVGTDRKISIGIEFHHGIYRQRPDVQSIVHSHGFWATTQAALGRPLRIFANVATPFHGKTCISPNDDFASIGPALGSEDIAIVIPWHGVITIGGSIAEAVALHTTFDYAARQDLMLPLDTPTMPEDQIAEIASMVNGTGYYQLTWELVRRTGKECFNGTRVFPRPMP
jgi:L-fuculose-phosphate aldolase